MRVNRVVRGAAVWVESDAWPPRGSCAALAASGELSALARATAQALREPQRRVNEIDQGAYPVKPVCRCCLGRIISICSRMGMTGASRRSKTVGIAITP